MRFDQRVPGSRDQVKGSAVRWLLWAFFGNDDDGVYGDKIPPGIQYDDEGYPFGSDQPMDAEHFWRWWRRNKAHNWNVIVLRRPVVDPIYIIGRPAQWRNNLEFAGEVLYPLVLRLRPFFIKIGPAFLGWRSDKPNPLAWGGKYKFAGAFDAGAKSLT